ncbi:MAG: hypothetical protein LBN32_02590 [Helicobacteraceae bacterium]|jgi:hypothetical protein|nr:hypothetical protein [Helicobacteraceae bacterium]
MSAHLNFRCDDELQTKIDRFASGRKISRGEAIKQLIERGLSDADIADEILRKLSSLIAKTEQKLDNNTSRIVKMIYNNSRRSYATYAFIEWLACLCMANFDDLLSLNKENFKAKTNAEIIEAVKIKMNAAVTMAQDMLSQDRKENPNV